jgi:hypothetical protein
MKSNRLAGHELRNEGRVYVPGSGYVSRVQARGKCSCGATSGRLLPNAAQRKAWHREHKASVRAAAK